MLLVAAGDNADRIRSEAAFAISAASLRSRRHRARRPGTGATAVATGKPTTALWRIVFTRELRPTPPRLRPTPHDLRPQQTEIIRVLKRYVAREVYRHIPRP